MVWVNENATREMLELDAVMGSTSVLCVVHALFFSGRPTAWFLLAVAIVGLAVGTEEASIQLGSTHCHTAAGAMVAPCSSLNSVLFYLPWMYSAIFAAYSVFGESVVLRAAGAGFVQFVFGMGYELQGPALGWWQYGADDVAQGAFVERVFGFPIVAALFHPAFGAGLVVALWLVGFEPAKRRDGAVAVAARLVAACLLVCPVALAFDLPIRAATALGVSRFVSVPCALFVFFLVPFVLAAMRGHSARFPPKRHGVLLLMTAGWHAYFVGVRWWHPRGDAVTADMYALVVVLSLVSLLVHVSLVVGARAKED